MSESEEERRHRALNLRKAGATYDQIAQQIGFSDRGSAYRAVREALGELPDESVNETMSLDEQRLEQLAMALWPRAMQGQGWAVERIIKVIELRLALQKQRREVRPAASQGSTLQRLRAVK